MRDAKPISDARLAALRVLQAIMHERQTLDQSLGLIYDGALSAQDKAFARQLVMQVLRHCGALDTVLAKFLSKPLSPKLAGLQMILRLGAVQLLLLETSDHAAINESVELAKKAGFKGQAGLVNAVLRNVQRAGVKMGDVQGDHTPKWLWQLWEKAYGKKQRVRIQQAHAAEPPLDVTVKGEATKWAEALGGVVLLQQTVRLATSDVTHLAGYEEGDWWVQDVAATLPVQLLGDVAGKRVVDLCAAPGGKTLQLAAAGAKVVAVDQSQARLVRVRENLARTGLRAAIVQADAKQWQPQEAVDAVLLDAPCSATGTIRRHPDIVFTKQPNDVGAMKILQREILKNVMSWLPVGVKLVYCTCSLQQEEGEEQVAWLLETYSDMQRMPVDAAALGWPADWVNAYGDVRTLPHYLGEEAGMDGFFITSLIRT